jgi:hypothetical protein
LISPYLRSYSTFLRSGYCYWGVNKACVSETGLGRWLHVGPKVRHDASERLGAIKQLTEQR